jgi:hypothetical protein
MSNETIIDAEAGAVRLEFIHPVAWTTLEYILGFILLSGTCLRQWAKYK